MSISRPLYVLRNRWTAALGLAGVLAGACGTVWLMVSYEAGGVNDAAIDRWFGGAVVLTFVAFIWHVTVRPRVLVYDWGVRVENPVFVHTAPWSDIEACDVSPDGMVKIITSSGAIEPFTFSGSLLALWGGARSARTAQRQIVMARDEHRRPTTAAPPVSRRFSLVIRPLLAAWAVAGLIAFLA